MIGNAILVFIGAVLLLALLFLNIYLIGYAFGAGFAKAFLERIEYVEE